MKRNIFEKMKKENRNKTIERKKKERTSREIKKKENN